jgi:thioredoxin-like negative regulator of GroEL
MKIVIKNNQIKQITITDFDEVTKSSIPYVVEFMNPTCHLCKALKPIYENIAEEYKDKFKFGIVNTTKERTISKAFKLDGVPEIFIIFEGDVYNIKYPEDPDPNSGYTRDYIVEHLDSFLKKR